MVALSRGARLAFAWFAVALMVLGALVVLPSAAQAKHPPPPPPPTVSPVVAPFLPFVEPATAYPSPQAVENSSELAAPLLDSALVERTPTYFLLAVNNSNDPNQGGPLAQLRQ